MGICQKASWILHEGISDVMAGDNCLGVKLFHTGCYNLAARTTQGRQVFFVMMSIEWFTALFVGRDPISAARSSCSEYWCSMGEEYRSVEQSW